MNNRQKAKHWKRLYERYIKTDDSMVSLKTGLDITPIRYEQLVDDELFDPWNPNAENAYATKMRHEAEREVGRQVLRALKYMHIEPSDMEYRNKLVVEFGVCDLYHK